MIPERPAWHARAACRGVGTEAFFPNSGAALTEARTYCVRCPVRAECHATGIYEHHGVWAGTSEKERRRTRTRLGITLTDDDPTEQITA